MSALRLTASRAESALQYAEYGDRVAAKAAGVPVETLRDWLRRGMAGEVEYVEWAQDYGRRQALDASIVIAAAKVDKPLQTAQALGYLDSERTPVAVIDTSAAVLALARDTKTLPTETIHARLSAPQRETHGRDD